MTSEKDRYARPPHLSPTAVDVLALLPDPPSNTSPEHQTEIQYILMLQHERTPAQVVMVKGYNQLSVWSFADLIGPNFDEKHCPLTAKFFDQAEIDEGFFARQGKMHWKRSRPTAEPGVHSPLHEGGYSYPSGHSTRATLFAELLADLIPERRDALLERGREIGFSREVAGVHYPSDVFAGRILGQAIAHAMLNSSNARAAMEPLRAEIHAAMSPISPQLTH